jgi:hypothetical protein
MQLRLPVVVIGGGLTAIDTATESLAYYVVQVEKFLARYEILASPARARRPPCARPGTTEESARSPRSSWPTRAPSAPSARPPPREGREPRASSNCCRAGAASPSPIAASLVDSPSYTLNHEEVEKALEEGIVFAEGPDAAVGRRRQLRCRPRAFRFRSSRRRREQP